MAGSQTVDQMISYIQTLQNNIIQLTALERVMNERILIQGGSSTMTQYLTELKENKVKLYQSLQTVYNLKQKIVEGTVKDYKNVLAVNDAVGKQLEEVKSLIAKYDDKIQGKVRMNQIAEYEYKKYVSYKRILKIIVYFSIIIIVL